MIKKNAIVGLFAAIFLVSGCYESELDLIENHAKLVERMDGVLVFANQAYYADKVGKTTRLCGLENKSDLNGPCKNPSELKLERTDFGNYIVQVKTPKTYYFALWARSNPDPYSKMGKSCVVWLGDGFTKMLGSSIRMIWQKTKIYHDLAKQLPMLTENKIQNRAQLISIVKIYENKIANPITNDWHCLGKASHLEIKDVEIDGDNRHLPDFTN